MIVAIPVFVAALVAARSALAPNLSVYDQAPYCKSYSLTAPKFMNIVKTIVDHGDLTDVSFIEKTIGTNLVNSNFSVNRKTDFQSSIYRSWQIQGAPVSVTLAVNHSKALQRKFDNSAQIIIETETIPRLKIDFFRDCLGIQMANIHPFFVDVKKSHPNMLIDIMYNREDNLVRGIAIYQKP